MKTIRSFCTVLLTTATLMLIPRSAPAPTAIEYMILLVHNHTVNESVELLVALHNRPGMNVLEIPRDKEVTWTYRVTNLDGTVVGEFSTKAPADGIAKVIFTAEKAAPGEVILRGIDKGGSVIIGIVDTAAWPEQLRLSYTVALFRSTQGINPVTREIALIPPSVGVSVATTTLDNVTGQTTCEALVLAASAFRTSISEAAY